MLFLVIAAATVSAQTTLPKPATAYDDQPIRRGHPADAPTTRASTGITAGRAATFLDLPRVLMALGIVLGLILILRLVARKLFPNATSSRASEVIRVLGRS